MANLESYLVQGYDLSGGDTTFLSDNISAFTTYFVTFIWSNVTGTLDGSLLIRDTDDDTLFNSLETVILDTSDETRSRPNINVKQNKLSIKFTANGVTGGKLSIKIKAVENILQAHESDVNAHTAMRAEFVAGNVTITGDLLFTGSGFVYANMYVQDNSTVTTITSSGKANKVQITIFNTNGLSNNATPDQANDHITIKKAGHYKVDVSITVSGSGGDVDSFGFSLYKNNGTTEFTNIHGHRNMSGGAGDIGSIHFGGIVNLAKNDTIEVWLWNEDDTDNITIDDISLTLFQLSGI